MATNKNAQARYKILDRCFSDKFRSYTFRDLCEEVNAVMTELYGIEVSERQIREDIKFMRERLTHQAPIVSRLPEGEDECRGAHGKEHIYYYSDPDYTIYKSQLSLEETEKLKSVVDMLRRFSGLPNFEWIDDLIIRLDDEFQLSGVTEHIIGFEQNTRLKGLEFLSRLIELIAHHQVIKVVYHNFRTGLDNNIVLHPYYLKQYNNRWFLFGRNHQLDRIDNLAIDRIKSFEEARDIQFIPKWDNVDFEHYFDNVVGVSRPREETEPDTILIKVDKNEYPFLESKPIHKSQQLVDSENCVIQIKAIPNYELDHQIIAYGSALEVLSPEPYRQRIMGLVQNIYEKYFPVKLDCTEE